MIYHPVWNSALQGIKERKHMLENYLPLLLNFCSSINCIIGIKVPEDYLLQESKSHLMAEIILKKVSPIIVYVTFQRIL